MRIIFAVLTAALTLVLTTAACAQASPSAPAKYRTLKDLLAANPDKPLHIVYIHGIRTSAAGFSAAFRATLCTRLGGCEGPTETPRDLDLGKTPAAEFVGRTVWNDENFVLSRPFVDHFVYRRAGKPFVIVDEVNYWPLLLALKCQFLVQEDAPLTGPDTTDLTTCSTENKALHLHAWITPELAQSLIATRPASGGGAVINKLLKTEIMNWGLSDAVIALGPMKYYTRLAIWCALEEIAAFDPDAPAEAARSCKADNNANLPVDRQFVIISESLGSFVLLDAFAAATDGLTYNAAKNDAAKSDAASPAPASACLTKSNTGSALCYIVKRSDNIYFFANQFPLLELGRLQGIDEPSSVNQGRISNVLRQWAQLGGADKAAGYKQLIAFNDPSDILTDVVPDFCAPAPKRLDNACTGVFTNLYVGNHFNWFGLFENPIDAHVTYSQNPKVLDVIYGK